MDRLVEQKENRKRKISCTVLLLILAASAAHGNGKTVSAELNVPVMRVHAQEQSNAKRSMEEIRSRLNEQRMQEMLMLDAVIDNPHAGMQTMEEALTQKKDIAQRMEYEAQSLACLEHLGFQDCSVLYGTQNMTIFIPFEYMENDKNRAVIVDAVSSLTGLGAEDIKIILAKK